MSPLWSCTPKKKKKRQKQRKVYGTLESQEIDPAILTSLLTRVESAEPTRDKNVSMYRRRGSSPPPPSYATPVGSSSHS